MYELLWDNGPQPVLIELIAVLLLPLMLFFKVIGDDLKIMKMRRQMKKMKTQIDGLEGMLVEYRDYIQLVYDYVQGK